MEHDRHGPNVPVPGCVPCDPQVQAELQKVEDMFLRYAEEAVWDGSPWGADDFITYQEAVNH